MKSIKNNHSVFRKPLFSFILILLTSSLIGCQSAAQAEQMATPAPLVTIPADTPTPFSPQPTTPAQEIEPTPTDSYPQTFSNPEQVQWVAVMQGFIKPLDLQSTGAFPEFIFVVEQPGRILKINRLTFEMQDVFLDIQDRVGSDGSEQGLLGLAFAPDFPSDPRIYLNYTDRNGTTNIARFQVNTDSLLADAASEETLLTIEQPYANHNGGGLAFSPDGYLYIGLGDGGSGGDPTGNAQNLETLLGKMLRIDVSPANGYSIPVDNPFQAPARPEIWFYGLRNPWRFHFDSLTGNFYIADVGQSLWEEVHVFDAQQNGGLNLGWNVYEGLAPYQGQVAADKAEALVFPVTVYDHQQGCSITGGVVYRGEHLPQWQGVYLYGDFCTGTIWGLLPTPINEWQSQALFQSGSQISAFGQDASGEIYYLDYTIGKLYMLKKIEITGN